MSIARRAATMGLLALPGALLVYTAFNGGGFFAGTQGFLAVGFAALLLVHVTVAEDPFAGVGRGLAVAGGALALLAGWMLLSSAWSDAPARALLEFDRALLYLLALVFYGIQAMTRARLRTMLALLALAALAVCTCALITRTLPEVWPVSPGVANERLSYPITYWNALGLVAVLGIVLGAHFTCSAREHPALRVIAAAAFPILCTTLYLTFSRASIVAASLGVFVYLVLARPRGAMNGLLSALPASAVAVAVAYAADELATDHPTTELGISQGRNVALAVVLCTLVAAAARAALLRRDRRMLEREAVRIPRRAAAVSIGGVAALALVVFLALGGPGYVSRQYDTFVNRDQPRDVQTGDLRTRLTDPSSNGRIDEWRVAVNAFEEEPLHGVGAGIYEHRWYTERPYRSNIVDAHSLYVEVLGELGLVGFALLVILLLTLLIAAGRRIRGPDRALGAVAFAVLLTWVLRAGVDWDWEMPVATLGFFCLGGAVLATDVPDPVDAGDPLPSSWQPPQLARLLAGLGCLVVAVTPFRVMNSQRELNAAVRAYERGRCGAAIDHSLSSLEWIGGRPEARLVLAYCDLRLGKPTLARTQMRLAVDNDPDNWQYRYVYAVTRGLLGQDPRGQMRIARHLNPLEEFVQEGVKRFATAKPKEWQRRAQRASLPGL